MSTGITINGLNVRTSAINVAHVDGWDGWLGKRGTNLDIPYIDGTHSVAHKFYPERVIGMVFDIFPLAADGSQSLPGLQHVEENLDALLGALHSDGLIPIVRTMPSGEQRQLDVEPLVASDVIGTSPSTRRLAVQFTAPNPFWKILPEQTHNELGIVTTSHAFQIVFGGNAPIHDAKVRFTANSAVTNPELQWDTGGDPEFIKYSGTLGAGTWIEFDCGRRIATFDDGLRADAGIDYQYPWWLRLPPTIVNFTALCSAASNWDVQIRYFNKRM